MSKKKDGTQGEGADKWAYLLKPAKDLTDNFSIDLLSYLNEYLDVIRHRNEDEPEKSFDVESNYKLFNFAQACLVIQGSTMVYAKKVDFILEEVYGIWGMVENSKGDGEGPGAGKKSRRKKVDIGSSNFDLIDIKDVKSDVLKNLAKTEKEDKYAIDNLRLIDNTEIAELQYERKNVRAIRPTQFMFGRNSCQFMRTDEQFYNAKPRPEVIGKVRDFDVKKSSIFHDHEMVIVHDSYKRNIDQFNLPGAKWIPDNKELAANFGVVDIEAELDLEKRNDRVNAYGPFKDPLSGRDIVAPPKWYIEQEAVRQHQETIQQQQTRSTSVATIKDSQGFGSQPTRLSQPFFEKQRNSLNQFVSFVEGRFNKNRPSTHLNTGLVEMLVDEFGDTNNKENANQMDYEPMDIDFDDAGGMDDDEEDYVDGLRKNRERRVRAPWDETDEDLMRGMVYGENDEVRKHNRDVKIFQKDPTTSMTIMSKKNKKNEKQGESRRDTFMRTQDYLQNHYYWRTSARLNPNNDWKIDALRTLILREQKRRARERTQKIRDARTIRKDRTMMSVQSRRGAREVFAQAFEDLENNEIDINCEEQNMTAKRENRKTLGAEYDDIADEDLAAEVEISMLGCAYDDDDGEEVMPYCETVPLPSQTNDLQMSQPQQLHQGLTFNAIDDAELANIFNLPSDLFMTRALPLLKKFAENRTDRDQMAYEMAKAYENIDVATSKLQQQVDEWQERLDPLLEEGETRKEYQVHEYGSYVLDQFENEGETKTMDELCAGKSWFEISRYFLSCLLMSNTKNVMISEDKSLDINERMNTMKISLISKRKHHEVFEQDGAL